MANWHVITGEYPPQFGGVSDYSRLVARGLASIGDNVDVWAPRWDVASDQSDGVSLNRLSDHFGPRSLATIGRAMRPDARLLVQYVPHAFGHKAMNVPFCAWLFSQRKKRSIDVMFHEVGFPVRRSQAIRYNFLGLVNRVMAMLVARSASRLFVAIRRGETCYGRWWLIPHRSLGCLYRATFPHRASGRCQHGETAVSPGRRIDPWTLRYLWFGCRRAARCGVTIDPG